MRARVSIGLVAMLALASTACIRSGVDHSVVDVIANEYGYSFDRSEPFVSGRTTIRLRNQGGEDHQAALVRLNEGVAEKDVRTALNAFDFATFFGQVAFVGGPATIAPTSEQVTDQDLTAGNYLFLCFVDAPDGTLHFAKGMIAPLTVAQGPPTNGIPREEAALALDDYSIAVPPVFDGNGSFRVANNGDEPHELMLLELAAGKDLDDVIASFDDAKGARPYRSVGGVSPIPPDGEAWLQLGLKPGRYAAVCFVPNAEGKAHFQLGMKTTFTIT